MPKEISERGLQLITYVQNSIQRLESGEITTLPTYQELSDQFGYRGGIYKCLEEEVLN